MERIFIGRQPILDSAGAIYGYELLHRRAADGCGSNEDRAVIDDGDRISADMLLNAVLEIGIQQIAGAHRSFINVTHKLLMNKGIDALPSDRVVLEVLENVPVDAPLLARLEQLRSLKFEIALDDYVCLPDRDALIAHADIVKLDVLALDWDTLARQAAILQRRGVRLLAEKVESRAMYDRLRPLGFEFFQGYFFARPETHKFQKLLPNKLILLELLARVNQPDMTPERLSEIIRGDVSLSVTVLRWANSSIYGMRGAIESIQRAIVVLGMQTIRNWVALLALARMGSTPSELLTLVLVRARTCELLATTAELRNSPSYFTVGLLSALDVMLQVQMSEALARLPLAAAQTAAIERQEGEFGDALKTVFALERGVACVRFRDLPPPAITDCYCSAIAWADNLTAGMLPH
jgi:EAL and modified HD-GYP domain-containing signal transduction protein